MVSSCGDQVNCLGPPCAFLANPVVVVHRKPDTKCITKAGIYSKAAIGEPLALLYKNNQMQSTLKPDPWGMENVW